MLTVLQVLWPGSVMIRESSLVSLFPPTSNTISPRRMTQIFLASRRRALP
jgi:hypothetical protein